MENPIERARAGIASDSEASTPGATTASEPSMPALATNATGTDGASAKSTENAAATTEATPSMVNTRRRPPAASRVAQIAPTARPSSPKIPIGAVMKARSATSRWNVCWYCSEASELNPAMAAARNGSA